MRVNYIHQYFALPESNGGIRSYTVAKELVSSGHAVKVITTTAFLPNTFAEGAGRVGIFEYEGISIIALAQEYSNRTSFPKRIWLFLEFIFWACLQHLKNRADISYISSTPLSVAFIALVGRALGKKYVFEVRDVWPEVPSALGIIKNRLAVKALKVVAKLTYNSSEAIVFLSSGMMERVLSEYTLIKPVYVIENFCENEIFSKVDALCVRKLVGVPVVTYTGTFGRVNDLSYILDLAKSLSCLGFAMEFHLYGDGREREFLVEKARALGIWDSYVKFFPPVSKAKLPEVLSSSTAMISTVLPIRELEDNSANKFFDSLAGARPIIINHAGWQKDYIEENGCGYVLSSQKPDEKVALDLVSFLDDRERLINSSSLARQCAFRDFDSRTLSRKIVRVLSEAVH